MSRAAVIVAVALASSFAWAEDSDGGVTKPESFLRVATIPMNGFGVKPELLSFFTEHYAQAFTDRGAQVTTPSQIQALIGFERQRQLLGCEESSECMTEIAAALGVDALATGEIAFLDASWRINLKVLNATTGEQLTSASARAASKEEVADQIAKAAHAMAPIAAKKLGKPLKPNAKIQTGVAAEVPLAPRRTNAVSYTLLGIGGALAVAGGAMLTVALVENGKLRAGDRAAYPTFADASSAQTRIHFLESFSYPLLATGLGLLAAGYVLYQPPVESPVKAALLPSSDGVFASVEVRLP